MATVGSIKTGSVGSAEEMKLALALALEEIFSVMFNVKAHIISHQDIADVPRLSSVVGFTGRLSGLLCLHFSSDMACNVAAGLLGMQVTHVDETVRDAIGELSNMLAGGLKKGLSKTDNMFKISIPSVVEGSEYSLYTPPDAQEVWLGISAGKCRFKVQLVLEPS